MAKFKVADVVLRSKKLCMCLLQDQDTHDCDRRETQRREVEYGVKENEGGREVESHGA